MQRSIDDRGPLCGCGKKGDIETLAAGPAIGRRAQSQLADRNQHNSILWELAGGNREATTSEILGRADAAGDAVALDAMLETAALLSVWLSNPVDLLEPDVIIRGGRVASMPKPFFEDIHERISEICVNTRAHEIPIGSGLLCA